MDEEYLKLFEKIKKENQTQPNQPEMMRETPDYSQLQNLNEVKRQPQQPQQPQNFNTNDFNVETSINGQKVNKLNEADPNGLNSLIGEQNLNEVKRQQKQEKLNEVLRIKEQERLNAIKEQQRQDKLKKQEELKRQQEEQQKLQESVNFKDADVITLDMFDKARYNSMIQIANKTIPK